MESGVRIPEYAWDLHYESAALTAELRARFVQIQVLTAESGRGILLFMPTLYAKRLGECAGR
jgi:hypothetical protein